jgi:hypothetical protein
MKCKVLCYVGGKTFDVFVEATNYAEAKIVAKTQHPNARIVGVTAVFK